MTFPPRADRGFSLIEALIVLTIMSIMAVVGVSLLGNRTGSAVRSMVDNLEGTLAEAHRASAATGRDTALDTWGNWTAAAPLTFAYGDASLTDAQIQAAAAGLVQHPPVLPDPVAVPFSQTVAVPLYYQPNDSIMSRARIVLVGSGDWATAMGATASGQQNQDLTAVPPFSAGGLFSGLMTDANNLCTGAVNRILIGGFTQRFNSQFVIQVVSVVGTGVVQVGGAMGVIVVQANGNSIYKFYNPGVLNGDGKWRKI